MMKKHLTDTFKYNDWANRKLLITIKLLPDKEESIKLFSHLITSQNKWLNRIYKKVDDISLNWFSENFPLDILEKKWIDSVSEWINFIDTLTEEQLEQEIEFSRINDEKKLSIKIKDIALQLNYHSIHHRAQINKLISKQGLTPPLTDYIFTVLNEH